eukprot:CAMPEP_0174311364 /NCGR_PEP_ID=MMETSP0810-20121108/3668_1 /TAXON_ID=73025 ORGANISM="Eutreptiella gymnastica-like, Strain CCMP1594" /NCGR_SAMPLE_ID=MMETSP0810 /ASSEMBLY_ACC=CAM_ASM_000659 /LENGTH=456 /DNA_ID=CAMNT_0015419587 /DNA_START=30 /DNA_END=1400 /DNA_ORIENTATION=+
MKSVFWFFVLVVAIVHADPFIRGMHIQGGPLAEPKPIDLKRVDPKLVDDIKGVDAKKIDNMKQIDPKEIQADPKQVPTDPKQVQVDAKQVNAAPKQVQADRKQVDVYPKQLDADVDPKQVDVDSKQVDVDPKQVDVDPEQVDVDPKQVDAGVDPKQVDVDSKQVDVDPKQVDVDPEQVDVERKQVGVEPKQVDADVDPKQADVDPKHADVDPKQVDPGIDPKQVDVDPKQVDVDQKQVEVVDTRPEQTEVGPEQAEAGPEQAEAGPEQADVAPEQEDNDDIEVVDLVQQDDTTPEEVEDFLPRDFQQVEGEPQLEDMQPIIVEDDTPMSIPNMATKQGPGPVDIDNEDANMEDWFETLDDEVDDLEQRSMGPQSYGYGFGPRRGIQSYYGGPYYHWRHGYGFPGYGPFTPRYLGTRLRFTLNPPFHLTPSVFGGQRRFGGPTLGSPRFGGDRILLH